MSAARFRPSGRLRGTLTPPPDKSISHRAVLLGAVADGGEPRHLGDLFHDPGEWEAIRAELEESQVSRRTVRLRGARGLSTPPIDDIESYWTPAEKAQAMSMLARSVSHALSLGFTQQELKQNAEARATLNDVVQRGITVTQHKDGETQAEVLWPPPAVQDEPVAASRLEGHQYQQ